MHLVVRSQHRKVKRRSCIPRGLNSASSWKLLKQKGDRTQQIAPLDKDLALVIFYFFAATGPIARTDVGPAFSGFAAATFDRRTIPARAPNGFFVFGLLTTIDFSTGFEMTTCLCGCPCPLEVDAERTSVTAAMKTIRLFMTSY